MMRTDEGSFQVAFLPRFLHAHAAGLRSEVLSLYEVSMRCQRLLACGRKEPWKERCEAGSGNTLLQDLRVFKPRRTRRWKERKGPHRSPWAIPPQARPHAMGRAEVLSFVYTLDREAASKSSRDLLCFVAGRYKGRWNG